jgi:Serine dehydrogenase proteinase
LSGQEYNDKQVRDEGEEVVHIPTLNDERKLRCEEDILTICRKIRLLRGHPLLLMYYPDNMGKIVDEDITTVYEQFRRRGFSYTGKKIPELDVLLHTLGGSPDAAYMIGQSIRSFCSHVNFLIPFHAASAGALLSFSGDKLIFGACAHLTPIDVSIGNVSSISVEYFMNFAVESRIKMESAIRDNKLTCGSRVESDLLTELVKQIKALDVGKLYRHRTLAEYYAKSLLSNHMFKDRPDVQVISEDISHTMVFKFPAHRFYMDYLICEKLGLIVEQMKEEESDASKEIVNTLSKYTASGVICKKVKKKYRIPFIILYVE